MQNTAWVELFRLIPEQDHHKLLLMTVDGSEVFISDLIRLEPEYMVVRGRVGGTSDTGMAFFVPYDRIVFARYQKAVAEEAIYGLYGLKPPSVKRAPQPSPEGAEVSPDDAVEALADGPEAPAAADGEAIDRSTPARGVSRQELLDRLRQRVQPAPAPKRPGRPGRQAPGNGAAPPGP